MKIDIDFKEEKLIDNKKLEVDKENKEKEEIKEEEGEP